VRVIVDSASQYLGDGFSPVTAMVNAGVKVHAFNPAAEWSALRWAIGISVNMRIHEKIMVVDGVEAITGGRNVGNRYLHDGNWRDTDIFVDGPAVADLQRVFLEDWDQFIAWERLAGCPQWYTLGLYCPNANPSLSDDAVFYPKADGGGATEVRVVYSDPRSQSSAHGWEAYLALVKAARTSVKITNAYFVPPKRMRDELKAAEARGV
jgi:cardiolipin synthase